MTPPTHTPAQNSHQTLQLLPSLLKNWHRTGDNQWEALCPCHDDNVTSFCVGMDEAGKLLFDCKTGCSTGTILQALDLPYSALFPDPPTKQNNGSGKRPRGKVVATYVYQDDQGANVCRVCRTENKDFFQQRPDGRGGWLNGMKGVRRVLYRLPEIVNSDRREPVVIVEGEKDADLLTKAGFIATTSIGGASKDPRKPKWKADYAKSLKGRNVVILPDNDPAGEGHTTAIVESLNGIAASIKVVKLPDLPPKGDVSDWSQMEGSSPGKLREIISETPPLSPEDVANSSARKATGTAETAAGDKQQPNESIDDPYRLARIYLDKNTVNEIPTLRYWRDQFHRHSGKRYSPIPLTDIKGEISAAVKAEFDRVNLLQLNGVQMTDTLPTAKKITTTLVNNVVAALASLTLVNSEIDQPCWLGGGDQAKKTIGYVATENGLIDLDDFLGDEITPTTEPEPHSPEWFSPVCLPYPWNISAKCPRWLQFLERNLEGDGERIAIIQEWFGYSLIPSTEYQKFLVLEGEGANGKSVVCAALNALLGTHNVSSVPLEIFGQRFALTQTLGKLANIASEVGDLDKVAEGYLKSFTSGDLMMFDRKNKTPVESIPTARLTIATNNRPRFADRSNGLWRRMILMPMRVVVGADERIPNMDKAWWWEESGELPAILLWAIDGLRRLREQNRFTESALCDESLNEYQEEVNPARAFLVEHYELDEMGRADTGELYTSYRGWCETNGYRPLAKHTFGKEVKRVFPTVQKKRAGTRANRIHIYEGISQVSEENEMKFGVYTDPFEENL